jgi:hypothetical protein
MAEDFHSFVDYSHNSRFALAHAVNNEMAGPFDHLPLDRSASATMLQMIYSDADLQFRHIVGMFKLRIAGDFRR